MNIRKLKDWHSGKPATLLLSLILIFGIAISGTFAYLYVSSILLNNSLDKVTVSSQVKEAFDGTTKSAVKIQNTGDISAWIRVALVPTWELEQGESLKAVNQTATLSDLNIAFNTGSWFQGADGYYYCKTKIAPGEDTPVLIHSATVKTSSAGYQAGYHMNLQILCEAVQSAPETAVNEVWKTVHVANGSLVG